MSGHDQPSTCRWWALHTSSYVSSSSRTRTRRVRGVRAMANPSSASQFRSRPVPSACRGDLRDYDLDGLRKTLGHEDGAQDRMEGEHVLPGPPEGFGVERALQAEPPGLEAETAARSPHPVVKPL